MANFKTYRAFQNFRQHVLREARYLLNESSAEFLKNLLATSEDRKREFPASYNFWRAQLGHGWETIKQNDEEFQVPGPHEQDRMRPHPDGAKAGRANPKGIPCLYVATDKETAMAEVRPANGDYVSVGQFKILRPITLIDCSVGHDSGMTLYFHEPTLEEREKAVWNDLDRAFSEPITTTDLTAEYAPTQIISELFRTKGYDGIAYKSNLGKGFNVAIFDLTIADIINCLLFQVTKVDYEFNEAGNPYFVRKYYEEKAKSEDST